MTLKSTLKATIVIGLTAFLTACPAPDTDSKKAADGTDSEAPASNPADAATTEAAPADAAPADAAPTEAAPVEEPAAAGGDSLYDVGHITVGQKYVFKMDMGMAMVYEITSINDDKLEFTQATIMGENPVGDPNPGEFALKAPEGSGEAAAAPTTTKEVGEETIEVSGISFPCTIMEMTEGAMAGTKMWSSKKLPFQTVKMEDKDGKVTSQLSSVE